MKSYFLTVLRHKWFVLIAGLKVGRFPLWRLIIHDWSKFLPIEYFAYRDRFTRDNYDKDEFDVAWLHHVHFNPHHYHHWILEDKPLPMPEIYVREMVIDWMAANKSYAGSWNIQRWLNESYSSEIRIHPITLERLKPILLSQGFVWPGYP